MTEQTQSQEQTPEKPTLEDLYSELQVPNNPAPQPTEPIPAGNDNAILKEVQNLKAELAAEKAARTRAQEDKDFNNAVDTLAKASGLKGKNTVLRGYLLGKASEDERLRSMWENRGTNPKTWERALELLADEAKGEFTVVDPQLEENQRAMDESQRNRSSTSPAQKTLTDDVMKKSEGEFEYYWSQLTRGT